MSEPKYTPPGMRFVNTVDGTHWLLIDDPSSGFHQWLCYLHCDGQNWVTHRKATTEEIERLHLVHCRAVAQSFNATITLNDGAI